MKVAGIEKEKIEAASRVIAERNHSKRVKDNSYWPNVEFGKDKLKKYGEEKRIVPSEVRGIAPEANPKPNTP